MAEKITTEMVQKLRETTGAGVMDCHRALAESEGDMDRAAMIIREKGLSKAEKRADRTTGAGLIETYVHNERIGVVLNVRAETDFVVRSEPFRAMAHDLAMHIAAMGPASVDELLKQPYVKDESRTVQEIVNDVIAKVGENVSIKEFFRSVA